MPDSNSLPLVSIITPSYNQAAYLEATLHSVFQQEYSPIEYIVIDGGSTDGSREILQHHAARFAYWVSEPDGGQAEAINKGLAHARGEYIAWLNSDDLYLAGAVRQAVAVLESDPEVGLVYGQLHSIDAQGEIFNTIRYQPYDLVDLLSFRIIGQPSVFIRRSCLARAGILDPGYQYLLDHQLWIRIAQVAELRYVPEVWASARHHEAAKNVAHAADFGNEVYRILAWAQSQPDLAALLVQHQRRVMAGAYRLDARYLLDGGAFAPSLLAYWRAFTQQPGYALQHWKRIAYAGAGVLGLSPAIGRMPTGGTKSG